MTRSRRLTRVLRELLGGLRDDEVPVVRSALWELLGILVAAAILVVALAEVLRRCL